MAIGSKSDMVIRVAEFEAAYIEAIDQNVADFNAGFGGAINLVSENLEGDYRKTRFFDFPRSGYVRRDITDTSTSLTPSKMTMDEVIGVKLSRRFGPYQMTEDAFRRISQDPNTFSTRLGESYAQEKAKDVVNVTIGALSAHLGNEGSNVYDYAATGSSKLVDHTALIRTKDKLGDASNRLRCWVGHSGAYTSLVEGQLSVASGNVGDFAVYQGQAGSLNLPFYTSDISYLSVSGTPGEWYVLGLVDGAASVFLSTPPIVAMDRQLGKENLEMILQGEDDYVLELKGAAWGGGVNPTTAAAVTGSNWTSVVASNKDLPGVRLDADKS